MSSDISVCEFREGDMGQSSIKIERMEEIFDKANGEIDTPHRHGYNTVVWVREGEGSHIIDFNEYAFGKDHIFFIGPGQIHQVKTLNRPRGWVITFQDDFVIQSGLGRDFLINVNLFRQYSESPPIVINRPSRLLEILNLLYDAFKEKTFEYRSEAQGAALKLFLIECIKFCDPENKKASEVGSPLLIRFKGLVNLHFEEMHKVAEYAEMLSVTPKYLNEVIKSTIGMTAKDYIIDRILIEAKRRLLHTDDSVKMIALSLGFPEPLHFNSFFKKRINLTPLQYRKESKNS
ncbi:MAG: helix-turn-helix transcriptional regulator [Bacteroidota bacterium]